MFGNLKVHYSNDARVGVPENDGKLTEILVKGHNNSVLSRGERENLIICWSCCPIANPDYIMTTGRKFGHHAGPNAGVERAKTRQA